MILPCPEIVMMFVSNLAGVFLLCLVLVTVSVMILV